MIPSAYYVSYSDNDLEAIAEALSLPGISKGLLATYRDQFQKGLFWFFSTDGWRDRMPSVELIELIERLERASDRVVRYGMAMLEPTSVLAKTLHRARANQKIPRKSPKRFDDSIAGLADLLPPDPDCPEDEFGDRGLATTLRQRDDHGEAELALLKNTVLDPEASVEQKVSAALAFCERAQEARVRARKVRRFLILPGNTGGDRALNGWLDDMLNLYADLTGRNIATSVGEPGADTEGIADGPLIRFLMAAFEPIRLHLLQINDRAHADGRQPPFDDAFMSMDGDAWRSRIRASQKAHAQKQD